MDFIRLKKIKNNIGEEPFTKKNKNLKAGGSN